MVLKFNTMNEADLAKIWMVTRKSTETFPAEWLMPSKLDSLSNQLFSYWTTEALPEEYIDYVKDLSMENRKQIWVKTGASLKKDIRDILENRRETYGLLSYKEYRVFHDFSNHYWDADDARDAWMNYVKERDKVLKKVLAKPKQGK